MLAYAEHDRADSPKESRSITCLILPIADRRYAADSGSSCSSIVVTKYPRRSWISFNVRNKGSRLLFESIMIKPLIASLAFGVMPDQPPRHEFTGRSRRAI